jgi:hypothetical protein
VAESSQVIERDGLRALVLAITLVGLQLLGLHPPASHASTQAYVKTPWGTRCQVTANEITCDSCEPGLLLDTPAGKDCPGPGPNEVAVDTSGTSQQPAAGVILPASPSIQQLAVGQTYHISGWTITVSGWVRFTNDATGHGMAVAAQNVDFF